MLVLLFDCSQPSFRVFYVKTIMIVCVYDRKTHATLNPQEEVESKTLLLSRLVDVVTGSPPRFINCTTRLSAPEGSPLSGVRIDRHPAIFDMKRCAVDAFQFSASDISR